MADYQFRTIKTASEGFYKEKGSKFIAYAYPVLSEEEVKKELENLRATYPDARHICYAFIIGTDKSFFRYSDDGEPNGTAGLPIYNQLRSFDLTNILVAVVRYFGGTKLGVSGLIEAYKVSTEDALNATKHITSEEKMQVEITYQYEQTSQFNQLVHHQRVDIVRQEYEVVCKAVLSVPLSEQNRFFEALAASGLDQ